MEAGRLRHPGRRGRGDTQIQVAHAPCPARTQNYERGNKSTNIVSRYRCHFQTNSSWLHQYSTSSPGWKQSPHWIVDSYRPLLGNFPSREHRAMDFRPGKGLRNSGVLLLGDKMGVPERRAGPRKLVVTKNLVSYLPQASPLNCSLPRAKLVCVCGNNCLQCTGHQVPATRAGEPAYLGPPSLSCTRRPDPAAAHGAQSWTSENNFSQCFTPGLSKRAAEATAWSQGSVFPITEHLRDRLGPGTLC